jgi:transposase
MKKERIERVEVSRQEIETALCQAKASLPEKHYAVLKKIVDAYLYLLRIVEGKKVSIRRLQRVLFGSKSEKTDTVCANTNGGAGKNKAPGLEARTSEAKAPGHGRNGAAAYTGAGKVVVSHETLQPGVRCPECKKGKVYEQEAPRLLVRVTGQAPIAATVYELQRLRCNLCGEIFTASAPEGVGEAKYDERAGGMIGMLKYGTGVPFNRLENLEGALGVPLPSATQWDIVNDAARKLGPAHGELVRQAAQGTILHNDDTDMRILGWMGKRREDNLDDLPSDRTGIFTSGIVSTKDGRRIALFFTGWRHAGENLEGVLARRAKELAAPIQMCDALSRNVPEDLRTILANCLCHARRQFVDLIDDFPDECTHILKVFREVYKNDALARDRGMDPRKRLRFHKRHSGPLLEKLQAWMTEQIDGKKVEPNSGLGEAIAYMLGHWKPLTLFLRKAAAPLDNNVCERALKKAILHRKNALFYKTENGARVGDLYMSLIHTCELNNADPFDYLVELQRHAEQVAESPENWMPWNYRAAVAAARR